jgi:hypothetical protein
MTLRPTPGSARQPVALDYEIAQEQASALGRLGRALEAALVALAEFDRSLDGSPDRDLDRMPAYQPAPNRGANEDVILARGEHRRIRAKLVAEAGDALWCFMVQRESCGLRDPRPVIRDYRVPAEVQNQMGIMAAPHPGSHPAPWPRRRPAT